MIIHIGSGYTADTRAIIGIFDMDNTTIGRDTRDFLKKQTENGDIIDISEDIPKSFIVAEEGTYLCQLAVSTLKKRTEREDIFFM